MRAFVALVLIVILVAAVATGVIYFSSDSQRSAVNLDKQRATEVIENAKQAGRDSLRRLDNAVEPDRTGTVPPSSPPNDNIRNEP